MNDTFSAQEAYQHDSITVRLKRTRFDSGDEPLGALLQQALDIINRGNIRVSAMWLVHVLLRDGLERIIRQGYYVINGDFHHVEPRAKGFRFAASRN